MDFIEYMEMSLDVLSQENVIDVRDKASRHVNVGGYNAAKTVETIKNDGKDLESLKALTCASLVYEATQQNWVDGRNEFSNGVLKKIYDRCKTDIDSVLNQLPIDQAKWLSDVASAIGQHMHRTNLQTFASLIIYVMGTEMPESTTKEVLKIRDNLQKFWYMPLI